MIMNHKDIATPNRTKEILQTYNLSAKKSLGQNFIIDTNILKNIVEEGDVSERTTVIEIGPGIGALTEQLAKQAGRVIAFEIDDRLLPVLEDTLSPYNNIEIIHKDILNVDMEAFYTSHLKETEEIVVVANLPYYITTPIILRFLESNLPVDRMVLMMQKEVASRLSAQASTKAYGSLSIAVQYYMNAEVAFTVPKTVFMPQPNVDSAIIKLSRKSENVNVVDEKLFFTLTRAAFVQRRKTLWNNLQVAFGKDPMMKEKMSEGILQAGIDPKRRGETLTIEEFARLSNAFSQLNITPQNAIR